MRPSEPASTALWIRAMNTGGRERAERRLAAILAADVSGYSRLIEADEDGTLGRLKALRAEAIDPKIAEHRGRLVKTTGDGLLVEFVSVVDALRCAGEIQATLAERNGETPADRRIEFRIGIHQGDVVAEDGDIFRRRGQCRRPARRARRTRWDLRLGAGPGGRSGQARPYLRGYGRPGAEEHYPPGPRLPGGDGCRRVQYAAKPSRPAAPRQAVDRGAALRQHERRSGAGVFHGRHGRGEDRKSTRLNS